MRRLFVLLFFGTIAFNCQAQSQTDVYVNGQQLQAAYLQQLEMYYQTKVQPGRYWYDPYCGLWGMEGGSALGVLMPNLQLGGALQADASGGNTGIFINGREIDATERVQWEQLVGKITPDRYLLDAWGNVVTESGVYQLNLIQVVQQQMQAGYYSNQQQFEGYDNQGVHHDGQGNTFYRNWYTDTGSGSSKDGFYIMGDGWSYSDF